MTNLPTPGLIYRGGPTIEPAWLRGRRLLVERIPTNAQVYRDVRERGPVAQVDVSGSLNPEPTRLAGFVEVVALARGRSEHEEVPLSAWDAEVIR